MAGGEREGSTAPGAASAAPGRRESVSVAGRSAVFRRRRFGPALLREAPRCSCPAVACGDRGVSDSTWAAGLLFGADGVAVTVSVDRTARDASQATATTSNASTVSASMQDICSCPLVPREHSRSLARPPPAVCDVHHARDRALGASGSIRPRRPSIERHGASVPTRVHLPPQLRHTRVSRKLRFGTWASPSTSYGCRARTGFPPAVWSPSLSGWLPTTLPQGSSHMAATIAPAPKRHQRNFVITLAATARMADLAPRHYRIPPPGDMPRKAPSAASGRRNGSDGALRLTPPAPDEHRHGADRRLVGAGRLHVAPAGVRRPRPARRGAMRGRDADEPTPHVLRTNDIAAAGSVAAAGRPPSREPLAMNAGRASRAGGRKRLAGRGAAEGVPEGGAAAPHRRHHGARHGPADDRESHQTVHRHQHPPRRPRGRSPPPRPAASSSSAWSRSTKCSDGSKAGRE